MPQGINATRFDGDAQPPHGGYLKAERMAICFRDGREHRPQPQLKCLAALEKAGQHDNTLILVLSDTSASHQMAFDNGKVLDGVRLAAADSFQSGPEVAAVNNTPLRNYNHPLRRGNRIAVSRSAALRAEG
ncbi:MAG: hypothetical protein R3C56_39315 [Pirellulaceae bacterium]